jgi:hypothetical protein
MFIYLEGKYNSLKGNKIILGTIMVIGARKSRNGTVGKVRNK